MLMIQENAKARNLLTEDFVKTKMLGEKIPDQIVLDPKNEEKFFKLLCILCKNESGN